MAAEAGTDLATRYTRERAVRHERLYGTGYQGPGQPEVFEHLAARLDLRPGMRVLDVGCGLGGDACRLVRGFGVSVVGLDAAPDMLALAAERAAQAGVPAGSVRFVQGDVRTSPVLEDGPFDVVWTRDAGAFLPWADKVAAWARLAAAQASGGRVLVTDYCIGPAGAGADFQERMLRWGQHMITPAEYVSLLEGAGYVDVVAEDRTVDLAGSQRDGLALLEREEEALVAEFGRAEVDDLRTRWVQKLEHSTSGQLVWAVVTARRP